MTKRGDHANVCTTRMNQHTLVSTYSTPQSQQMDETKDTTPHMQSQTQTYRTSMLKSLQSRVVDAAAGLTPPSTTNALLLRLVADNASPSAGGVGVRDRILAAPGRGVTDSVLAPAPTHRSDRLTDCCDRLPPKPNADTAELLLFPCPHAENIAAPTRQQRRRLLAVVIFLSPLCLCSIGLSLNVTCG